MIAEEDLLYNELIPLNHSSLFELLSFSKFFINVFII
jgi:hypothetical protein